MSEGQGALSMAKSERIRGTIMTGDGDKIPYVVDFHGTCRLDDYSQVACVTIPDLWVEEYAQNPAGFTFRSNEGECFAQLHVLDATGPEGDEQRYEGRIYLLRELTVPYSLAAASLMRARPSSMPLIAGE